MDQNDSKLVPLYRRRELARRYEDRRLALPKLDSPRALIAAAGGVAALALAGAVGSLLARTRAEPTARTGTALAKPEDLLDTVLRIEHVAYYQDSVQSARLHETIVVKRPRR